MATLWSLAILLFDSLFEVQTKEKEQLTQSMQEQSAAALAAETASLTQKVKILEEMVAEL
jgi:hypothetical protein